MITILIGPRAAGKTTIGRQLASRLHKAFIDLDDQASAQFRERSIRDIWTNHGEAAWRNAERVAFERLTADVRESQSGMVLALGGGAPMVASIRAAIMQLRATSRARVAYLRCSSTQLAARLAADPGDRPSLTGQDIHAEVAQVLAMREPTYLALSDLIVDTSSRTPEQSVTLLVSEMATGR